MIPAFNEAGSIAAVVEAFAPLVDRVIVVDDGSTDGTAERARAAGAEVHRRTQANRGQGHAVRTGLARVFDGDFTHVLLLDGDMQHLPEEAARCSTAAEPTRRRRRARRAAVRARSDAGVALSREPDRQPRAVVVRRRAGRDTQCGFRVFRVDALRPLRLNATGYEIETEMLVKVRRRGGRVATVPVTAVYAGQQQQAAAGAATRRAPVFWRCTYRFLERL